jgi:hypothetical protein
MDRAICLGDLVTEEMRGLMGNRCFGSAGLVIGSGDKKKVKIANTVPFCIDGILYSKTTAEIVHTDVTVQADLTTKWYLLSLDKDGNGLITQGPAVLTASVTGVTNELALPKIAASQCAIGAFKIVTAGTTFTPATSDHDKASLTTTYYNLSCVPTAGVPA